MTTKHETFRNGKYNCNNCKTDFTIPYFFDNKEIGCPICHHDDINFIGEN